MKALIILTTLLALSCHPRPRLYDPVSRPGYVYVQIAPQEFHVVAGTQKYLDNALKDIGCGVCTVALAGQYYIVSVPK